jgi:hypothetical protein
MTQALPPIAHLEMRINRAVKTFNRATAAIERESFSIHHYRALRDARDEIAKLAALFRDKHWGNLHEETTGVMAELVQDTEELMQEVIEPAFNRKDERTKHPSWPNVPSNHKLYTCTRVLEFQGQHYRKDLPTNSPAAAIAQLDAWEKQLVDTLVPAESRA